MVEKTKLLLEKAQNHYENQVNARRREVEYKVGQKVLLNVKNFTMPEGLTSKFLSKFASPFPIECISKDVYKLELPLEIKVHLIFHISLFKPFKENTLLLDCKQVNRPPSKLVDNFLDFEVEGIIKNKSLNKKDKEHLVKSSDYHEKEAMWVLAKDIDNV